MSLIQHRTIYMGEKMPASIVLDDGRLEVQKINVELLSMKDSDDSDSDSSGGQTVGGTRKRRRLTNLTAEEKMLRRKLKNRVAAQTARDRKKQRMSELEEALAAMEAENKKLLAENATLKRSTNVLSKENVQLKERLHFPSNTVKIETSVKDEKSPVVVVTGAMPEPESAVLTSPQQKDQARAVVSLMTIDCLTTAFVIVSLMHCLTFWTSFMKVFASKSLLTKPIPSSQTSLPSEENHLPDHSQNPVLPPWWGSHQRNWNPSKDT